MSISLLNVFGRRVAGGHSGERGGGFGPGCLYPWGGRKEGAKRAGACNILCM